MLLASLSASKEVEFTNFLSGGHNIFTLVNRSDGKVIDPTSVHCACRIVIWEYDAKPNACGDQALELN